jgi:integrase
MDLSSGGKRVRRRIPGARSKTEAQAALSAVQTDILRGAFNFKAEQRVIFGDFAKIYLERHAKPNKRSWKRDEVALKVLKEFFKGMPLQKISPFLIEGYKKKRQEEVEVSSVNRELSILKTLFTKAIDWGYATENPASRVKLFNEKNRLRWRELTSKELDSLLSNSSSPLRETIIIAVNTGMRIGELMALRWTDVYESQQYLVVRDSKSGRSRKVPLNSLALEALGSLKTRAQSADYVFPNPSTGSFTKYPRRAFLTACRRAGIEDLRIHDLRHYAATAMVRAGVDLHTVSKILGHSTIKLTERYSHPGFDHTLDAVKLLESRSGRNGRFSEANGTNMAQVEIPKAANDSNIKSYRSDKVGS